LLAMPPATLVSTGLTLLAGTPALTLLGAIGAGLTVSLRRGGLLLPILVLPFAVPVLIFGVAAASEVSYAAEGFYTPFLLLCAVLLVALAVAPLAAAAALRHGVE